MYLKVEYVFGVLNILMNLPHFILYLMKLFNENFSKNHNYFSLRLFFLVFSRKFLGFHKKLKANI